MTSRHCRETWSARIAAAISSFHLFGAKIFWVEISAGRKTLVRSFSWVECAIGADMVAGSDSAVVHNLCWMGEPMYRPVAENDFVGEESVCAVAIVDESHIHEKVSDQFSPLAGSSRLLFDPQI